MAWLEGLPGHSAAGVFVLANRTMIEASPLEPHGDGRSVGSDAPRCIQPRRAGDLRYDVVLPAAASFGAMILASRGWSKM